MLSSSSAGPVPGGGHVDELELHVVPLLLGGGARLFEGIGPDVELEQIRVVEAPGVAHLKYRVVKQLGMAMHYQVRR